jgi:hypothetical protein
MPVGQMQIERWAMFKLIQSRSRELVAFAFALSLVVACGGDTQGDGGAAPQTPVGQEFGNIDELADALIGANAKAYEGVAFAAAALEGAFGSPAASAAVVTKQESCIPADLQNTTLAYDPPSGIYTSTQIPGAPEGGLRILVYEIEAGAPTANDIGSLDVTCSGFLPNPELVVTLNVNGVDVLKLNAVASLGFDYYSITVSGFLADATGTQKINYEERWGSGGSRFGDDSNFGVTFTVGDNTYATLSRFVSPSIPEESMYLFVFKEGQQFFTEWQFQASPVTQEGTGEVMLGHATFELNPDAITGYSYDIVACFEGTFENMSVMRASECFAEPEIVDLIDLPPSELQAMEDGYHGLQRMYAAVERVSTAAAAIGLAALADMNQQGF